MSEDGKRDSANQSVERAVAILKAFTLGEPLLRVSDIAEKAGLGISTASRLLGTLESLGLVGRDPLSQLYRLGPEVLTLSGIALNNNEVYRQARPIAQMLASRLGLAANVAIPLGDEIFYLFNVEGELAQKSFSLVGQRNPLHATALGKCFLLELSPTDRRQVLARAGMPAFTANTRVTVEQIEGDLALVSERGYATEVEELALARACLAVGIRDNRGRVVAGISVSGALSVLRLQEREAQLAQTVIEAADAISLGLGYLGPVHTPAQGSSIVPASVRSDRSGTGQVRHRETESEVVRRN